MLKGLLTAIPFLILLIIVLLILGMRYVFIPEKEDAELDTASNSSVPKPDINSVEVYRGNHLTKWIKIAWENTWSLRIERYYWEADRVVREMLQKMGWRWT